MANNINPLNNGRSIIDELRAKIKAQRGGATESAADADTSAKGAAADETAAKTDAPKTANEQLKDIFEKSGIGDLFKKAQTPATYGPSGLSAGKSTGTDLSSLFDGTSGFDKLLKDLGIDLGALTKGTDGSAPSASQNAQYQQLQYARVQYELNISVMQQVNDGNETVTQAMNFSLKFDYEWLGASTGQSASKDGQSSLNDIFGLNSDTGADGIMKKLQEYFNPENTAGRILDFAKGFYPNSKWAKNGDTEESRQGFSDYIGAAIQKGFDQAMGILGKVDNKTQEGIDKTHSLVFDGLKDFVKNGMSATDAQRAANTEAWRMSMEMSYTSVYMRQNNTQNAGNSAAADTTAVDPAAATADAQA